MTWSGKVQWGRLVGGLGAGLVLGAAFLLLRGVYDKNLRKADNLSFGATGGCRGCTPSLYGSSLVQSPSLGRIGDISAKRGLGLRSNVWRYGPFGRYGVRPITLLEMIDDLREEMESIADARDERQAREEAARKTYFELLEKARREKSQRMQDKPIATKPEQVTRRSPQEISPQENWMVPSLKMSEADNAYNYRLDIQGMDRDNLKLTLQENVVIVEGNKVVETDDGYHSSSFKRSFTLPPDADLDTLRSKEVKGGELILIADKLKPTKRSGVREIKIERLSTNQAPEKPKASEDGADAISRAINGKPPRPDGVDDGHVSDS